MSLADIISLLIQAAWLVGLLAVLHYRVGRMEREHRENFKELKAQVGEGFKLQEQKNSNFVTEKFLNLWVTQLSETVGEVKLTVKAAHDRIDKLKGTER